MKISDNAYREIIIEHTNDGDFLDCPLKGRISEDDCKPSCHRFISLLGVSYAKTIMGIRCRRESVLGFQLSHFTSIGDI